jgi:hypothetical protein
MTVLKEGDFEYHFKPGWIALKWDETEFHRMRFQAFGGASKAAEFVAFDELANEVWLVECKDFRPNGRSKTVDLCDEIAQKFRCTLAALVCARNDTQATTRQFARTVLKKTGIRCVVHWEHPHKPHRLWPSENMDRAKMRAKLRQRLAVADPKAELGNHQQLSAVVPWDIRPKQVSVKK